MKLNYTYHKMKDKISAIIPVYHGEKTIKETLKSLEEGVVDEIIVVHDGPCKDNTLKIARKYTKKIYVQSHKGRSAFPFAFGLKGHLRLSSNINNKCSFYFL